MDDVLRLDAKELLRLFCTLEVPGLDEMHGEYAALLLRQSPRPGALFVRVYNPLYPGHWLAKAFRPVNEARGRGYNSFRRLGRVVQRYPMVTLIAPSRYDGRPAFQLVYRAFDSFCGRIHMVDEVRRLATGRYLGIGTFGFTERARRKPCPFLLTGPVAPYRADIGGTARMDSEVEHLLRAPGQTARAAS